MDPNLPTSPSLQQPLQTPLPTSIPTPAPPQSNISGVRDKAGFIVRTAASMADGLIVGFATTLLSMLLKTIGFDSPFSQIINGLIFVVYSVLGVGLYGKTLGKAAFGLRVINYQNLNPGIPMAILRELVGKLISSLVLNLGFFWVIWDKNKQGWHDKIAKTYVLQEVPLKGSKKVLAYILVLGLPILAILGILAVVGLVATLPNIPKTGGFNPRLSP